MLQINNIRVLHELGYCHNDIKPDNILLKSKDYYSAKSSIVCLIDFSASQLYLDHQSGKHFNMKITNEFNGNFAYSSKNQMLGMCKNKLKS